MAAPLTVWMGRSGSGKSTRLYDRLIAHAQKGERATLVVAEQYTFEAEKALCSRLGGLLGVQVLSFSRLCERVLQERGAELPVIGGPGRRMILRRAALNRKKELTLFGRVAESRGFAQRMDEIITRCKQSGAGPEDLRQAAEALPEGSQLRGKLADIAISPKATCGTGPGNPWRAPSSRGRTCTWTASTSPAASCSDSWGGCWGCADP